MFLFAARDIWFVIALPMFLQEQLYCDCTDVDAFLATWVIGYGLMQSVAPFITGIWRGKIPDGRIAML